MINKFNAYLITDPQTLRPQYKKKTKETKQQSCMYLGLACLPVTIHVFELILNDIKNSVNDLSMYKNE